MRTALAALALALAAPAAAQQVAIDRVDQMPALPADYALRDWDRVAQRFDSLAFDAGLTGTYLPLVGLAAGGVNYPAYGSFGIETYVGGGNELSGEAITVLPALVGGTLAGADKRTQFGTDWVLRSQQFFNRRPEENVYLNGPQATSGQDWWYDTMPNVFFYQLYAHYPGAGDSDAQFVSVAEQWLRAVEALGGSATPWSLPAIAYRGFALSTMTPNSSGVFEPEAAGAMAWILYSAFRETGDARYRIAAELALDALDAYGSNPSYELQLPYGTLAAARLNAEMGAHYDVEQLLTWSFERGGLRGWGTLADKVRGGKTLDGLVGEVDGDGYAFALNGFQQAAALVPVARYDDRFARALGRWMVNLGSASRLFYRPFLPDANQDSEAWSAEYDPEAGIPYEALRGSLNGQQPFATGDAIGNGWAPTNLALYGGASVGYLAALVEETEVEGVLRLDLRATDVFRGPSFPSFLVYNPTATDATVTVPLPFGTYDVYDAVTDAFLARGVSGQPAVTVPPDQARVLVFPTAGGAETTVDGVRRVNGVAIDYRVGTPDRPPRVRALVADDSTLARGQAATLWCEPGDAETAEPTVTWSASGGSLVPAGQTATFSSPDVGDFGVTCTVTDGAGQTGAETLELRVFANQPPTAVAASAAPAVTDLGGTTTLSCQAEDPDGDAIAYAWTVSAGSVSGDGATVTFTAPEAPQTVTATCTAQDPDGEAASGTVAVVVGRLVLDLALDGAAIDASGFGHDGTLVGPTPAPGRTGAPASALRFDGQDDRVEVPTTTALSPTAEVSVSLWARPDALPDRELFLISHGSWQNRWKLSVTPDGRPRWSVRTDLGVADLDAPGALSDDGFTHLAATFDGVAMRIYVDGDEVASRPHAGSMPTVSIPLLLGQMLPGQTDFNFPGVLDDVKVFNRALSASDVQALYSGIVEGEDGPGDAAGLGLPFPNPAAGGAVSVPLALDRAGRVEVAVVDALGRTVAVLWDGELAAGTHVVRWDAGAAAAGAYVVRLQGDAGTGARRVLVVR